MAHDFPVSPWMCHCGLDSLQGPPHQHPQAFIPQAPRLGAHPWMPACLHCSRVDPSQARGHHPIYSGLALVAWIPAFSDFPDFGVSLPCWTYPSFLHLPAFTFFSDLGFGLLTYSRVSTTPSTLGNSEPWILFSFRSRTLLISNSLPTLVHVSAHP